MKIRPHLDRVMIERLLKMAAPYGIAFLCMALYRQFDVTMIALLRPDFELQNAYYGFVVRMVDMGFLLPTFLLNSTLPMLSERDAKGEDTSALLGKTLLILLLLGSISALFSALWARPLVQLLTTDSYLSTAKRVGSDSALQWMSIPLFLNVFVMYGFYVLLTKHKWQRLVLTLLIGAILSLAANSVLIPMYGFMGAVTTSAIIHVYLSIALFTQAVGVMPIHMQLSHIGKWFAFSVMLAASLAIVSPYLQSELYTIFGLVFMSILLLVLGAVAGFRPVFWPKDIGIKQ